MSDIARKVTWALIPSIFAGLLVEFLISNSIIVFEIDELRELDVLFLSIQIFRLPFVVIILALPSYYVTSYIIKILNRIIRRRKEIQSSSGRIFSSKRRPETVYWQGKLDKYDVIWRCEYGERRRSSQYAYVEGHFVRAVELN